jgi:hypothetical protein
MPTTAFLLELAETPQDNAFAVRQSIPNVGYVIARITVRHDKPFLSAASVIEKK